MIAGVPGTGIGGIFYLASAVCMPIRELPRLLRGKSSLKRWQLIFKQWGLSLGIMLGFWVTGCILAMILPSHYYFKKTSHNNVLHLKPLVISLIVLTTVLALVEISRFLIPKPKK